jgi:O-antigen/teichoic acid export membrane protein
LALETSDAVIRIIATRPLELRASMTGAAVARAGATSLAFRVLQGTADFLVVLVTARWFGAEGRGMYALATLTAGFAILPFAGVSVPMSAQLAHRRASVGQLHATVLVAAGVAGAVIAAALLSLASVEGDRWPFMVYAAIAAPLLLLAILQQELYRTLGEVRRMSLLYLGMSVATLLAFACAAAVAAGDAQVALAAWAAAVVCVALSTIAVQVYRLGLDSSGAVRRAWGLLRKSGPFSLANGVAWFNYRIDVFVVAVMLPLSQVGLYSVALAMGEALWQVSRAVVTGAYSPLIRSSDEESAALAVRLFRHALLLLSVGGAAGVIAAQYLSGSLFGPEFGTIWIPLAILIPGIVARGSAEVLGPFLLIRLERSREWLEASIGGLILNLVLAVALVPPLGIEGAALSTTVSYVAGAAYLTIRFRRLAVVESWRRFLPCSQDLHDYRRLAGMFRSLLPREHGA